MTSRLASLDGAAPAPVPVSAQFDQGLGKWSCTFDQLIDPVTVTPANWFIWQTPMRYPAATASVLDYVVKGTTGSPDFDPRGNIIRYWPPPFDVTNYDLVPAEAFDNFPLS